MRRAGATIRIVAAAAAWMAVTAGPAHAGPAWRLRLDTSYRTFAFRGVELDSIRTIEAVRGPFGGLQTRDGYAVTTPSGSAWSFYFRPGDEERASPVTGTADFTAWDLGPRGLSLHVRTRAAGAFDSPDAWENTSPAVRFQEAYADWTTRRWSARAGRMRQLTRFGSTGWDGGRVEGRVLDGRLRAGTWGGWALSSASDLPATNASLDPLDEYLPAQRPVLLGADLSGGVRAAEGRVLYERQVDTRADDFVSERLGAEISLRPVDVLTLSAGGDRDLAVGDWGNAEAALRWQPPLALENLTLGARRHQPRFDLWNVWTAFSPVAYRAVFAEGTGRPIDRVRITLRGERYSYDDTDADAPRVPGMDDGWRWTAEGAWDPDAHWRLRGSTHRELGPGAGSKGFGGEAGWVGGPWELAALGTWMDRPLEFRYDDVTLTSWGLRAGWRPRTDFGLHAEIRTFDEERDRPDAAAYSDTHVRGSLGATFLFGSGSRRAALPAAVRAIPPRRVTP